MGLSRFQPLGGLTPNSAQGWIIQKSHRGRRKGVSIRVDATHFSFSNPNSPLQGIPKYEIRIPCKVSGQMDQFVLGPQKKAQKWPKTSIFGHFILFFPTLL